MQAKNAGNPCVQQARPIRRMRAPPRSADFQVGCVADFPIREPGKARAALDFWCVADLEIGATAGLETCIACPALFTGWGSALSPRWLPQPVNNAVATRLARALRSNLGAALVRTWKPARLTSLAQPFDQSRHPGPDTHTQVPTTDVSHYTDCAPGPQPE